jgi:hypothetical protein
MKEYRKPVRICSLEALHTCARCQHMFVCEHRQRVAAETKRSYLAGMPRYRPKVAKCSGVKWGPLHHSTILR